LPDFGIIIFVVQLAVAHCFGGVLDNLDLIMKNNENHNFFCFSDPQRNDPNVMLEMQPELQYLVNKLVTSLQLIYLT